MSVTTQESQDGRQLTIAIDQRFDFGVFSELRTAYHQERRFDGYAVDLHNVTYMDSSALGMLLQLAEFAGTGRQRVRIVDPPAGIREVLQIAHLDEFMTVEKGRDRRAPPAWTARAERDTAPVGRRAVIATVAA
jgi:anti-anti-sigma factor